MSPLLKDTMGLGFFFWLIGYLLSLFLYFVIPPVVMGWIICVIMTPFTILVTWWWFRTRSLPFGYYVKVAASWVAIAIVADYLFIVRLFSAEGYYHASVLAYYVMTFAIPLGMGLLLKKGVQA